MNALTQWKVGRSAALVFSLVEATILSIAWCHYRLWGVPDDPWNYHIAVVMRQSVYLWPVFFAVTAWAMYRYFGRLYPRPKIKTKQVRGMGGLGSWIAGV